MATRVEVAAPRSTQASRTPSRTQARLRKALSATVPVHGGRVVELGETDSVSTFPSAVEAVHAAIEIQTALGTPPAMRLRIGIHQGQVAFEGTQIVGDCVQVAVGVRAAAVPGGIAITDDVLEEIRSQADLMVLCDEDIRLEGVARALPVYAVAAPGVAVPASAAPVEKLDVRARRRRRDDDTSGHSSPAVDPADVSSAITVLPLVGRETELAALRALLDDVDAGRGRTLFLQGESGVGKTRLAEAIQAEAEQRGWAVAVGRANQVETDLPYALLADALLPTLHATDVRTRDTLSHDMLDELAWLFPTLGWSRPAADPPAATRPTDFRNRLFWNLAQFLEDYGRVTPLLVVVEDLHWADASSLQLLHFLARQTTSARVAFLGTCRTDVDSPNSWLRDMERSLVSLEVAACHTVPRLTYAATEELVRTTFRIPESVGRPFTALLFGWTRGNPFFIEEVLKALVESRSLYVENGVWLGWDLEELVLPESVRATVALRAARLDEPAARVTELAAVLGDRFRFDQLLAVSGLTAAALLPILDQLVRHRILVETGEGDTVSYEFEHPVVRETLYANLGRARAGVLHGAVAQALEELHGTTRPTAVGELAYHYARAIDQSLADKAVRYLEAAGRAALVAYANPEALKYLRAALDRVDSGAVACTDVESARLIAALAHAHQRLGRTEGAIELWERACAVARAAGSPEVVAQTERRLGLAYYWTGRAAPALQHFEAGAAAAREAGDPARLAMLQVARGLCLQELGRAAEALHELEAARERAEQLGSDGLLARVHRAFLLIFLWTGPPEQAERHGQRALELAEKTGDVVLSFWVHWAMAVLAGLTGNADRLTASLARCDAVADQLRSPLLRIWSAEIAVEFAFGGGRWDEGLNIGENAINMARVLNQPALLPRLLVWTALIYLGRHDLARGKAYIDEAWDLARGAGGSDDRGDGAMPDTGDATPAPASVHAVIPAHIGRASYCLVTGDYNGAIAIAEAGLEIVDRTGYDVWAVHRLLPVAAEASLYLRDLERAQRYGARLRAGAERFGNQLGLAWADACDALVVWLKGDVPRGADLMRQAAARLEAIPFVPDATRLRRQLAGRLADIGDREGALRELRVVHETLLALGAEKELERTRNQFRELEARPPTKRPAPGAVGLTGRELELARAVAEGLSNKAIAKQFGISVRTVTTHLTNAFRKLDVSNRTELADTIRDAERRGEITHH